MDELDLIRPCDISDDLKDFLPPNVFENICLVESNYKIEGYKKTDGMIHIDTSSFEGYVSFENYESGETDFTDYFIKNLKTGQIYEC